MSDGLIRIIPIEIAVPAGSDDWMDVLSDMRDDSKGRVLEWRAVPTGLGRVTPEQAAAHFQSDVEKFKQA